MHMLTADRYTHIRHDLRPRCVPSASAARVHTQSLYPISHLRMCFTWEVTY